MWRMLQQDTPDDYVVSPGKMISVREFCELAFAATGMPIEWRGEKGSVLETAVLKDAKDSAAEAEPLIAIDAEYFRP
jgi:GDPmannose 4,6-dehydratase